MTRRDLKALATRLGIAPSYVNESGESVALEQSALEALVTVMEPFGPAPENNPVEVGRARTLGRGQRIWGGTCQLYALRSRRNLGIGDFSDLASLATLLAAQGADFLGVNPLHALFTADPTRISPYAPSTRRFLNPIYIAVDWIESGAETAANYRDKYRQALADFDEDFVDYPKVWMQKSAVLRALFDSGVARGDEFVRFCSREGADLTAFAVFETLSKHHAADGRGAGWHDWPERHRVATPQLIAEIAERHPDDFEFAKWLQFIADSQLSRVQRICRADGMQVGLYLDLAIGVAVDGFDTWSDPALTTPNARIGSPPDPFNANGQDWGLAPMVPSALAKRGFAPLKQTVAVALRHAGAVRIDHAMALERLWWIPTDKPASAGGYVRYPGPAMTAAVISAARAADALVIGEDLGTVPPGFRRRTARANIHSYRVLYFEKDDEGFVPIDAYPIKAMATLSTHDLPTLCGWWQGSDITLRLNLGLFDADAAATARVQRREDKLQLLRAMERESLGRDVADVTEPMTTSLASDVHAFVARSKSQILAVQLEDMLGQTEQANLPGTVDEHPNWRRRYPVRLEALAENPGFVDICKRVASERRPASA